MLTEILFATIGAKTAARAMAVETAKATATGKDMARGMEKVINTERMDKKQDRSSERSCFLSVEYLDRTTCFRNCKTKINGRSERGFSQNICDIFSGFANIERNDLKFRQV